MSGNSIAYHLRENKAIERNLFIELLRRVGNAKNISSYQYIGFGGPFLEDYRLIHHALRINDMHSIERDENTHKRQNFNRPVNLITLHHCDSSEFFHQALNTERESIVWLDYTNPQEISSQLNEMIDVASQLGEYDVLKITVNANPSSLGYTGYPSPELQDLRLEKLKQRLGVHMIDTLKPNDLITGQYPHTLQKIIRKAISSLGTRVGNLVFQPLATFKYKDGGHTMLTVTGIMLRHDPEEIQNFIELSRFEHWDFKNLTWEQPPTEISVPTLSIKERLHIEEILPIPQPSQSTASSQIKQQLGFSPCEPSEDTLLDNYAKFYRSFPYFSKVAPT